jgi:hypothetical protein
MPLSINFNIFYVIIDHISIVVSNRHIKMTSLLFFLVAHLTLARCACNNIVPFDFITFVA